MATKSKSDPMKVFGFVLIVAFGIVALAVVGVSLKKSTEKRTKAYTCTKVADPKHKVNATSNVLSLNPENKEFTWKPDQKSVIRTVLGGCDGVTYVRRGYAGEEEGDTPMKFEDLKVRHLVEVIGNSETNIAGARIVPSIVRDVSLYSTIFKGKVQRMIPSSNVANPTGFVMTDVVRKGNGTPVGNDITVNYSNKVGCRRYGETDYTIANCTGIRVGHMVEVAGVYDATIKSFIDPVALLPADGSTFWTQIYDASLKPDSNAKDWSTDDVSFTVDNFYMVLDGKTYVGDGLTAGISDPADTKSPDYTTILRIWSEKGDNVKVKFSFRKNATDWWVQRLQSFRDGQWTDYQIKTSLGPAEAFVIKAAKDTEFTAQTLDIVTASNEKIKGKIHFEGMNLTAFLNWITRAPTPTPTPTLTPTPTSIQQPDLAITNHKVEKWDNAGKSVKATFRVKNNGTASTRVLYNFTERSGGEALELPVSTCKVDQSTVLAAGKSCDVIHVFTYPTTGAKVLTLTVDPQNEIEEMFESNNVRSANFTVTN